MTMTTDKQHIIPNAPNLRFPEFEGEWRKDIIGSVAPLQRGFDLPNQNIENGVYPVVYSNGILRNHKYYQCEAPGLVTGRSGTIGNFTYIHEGKYWPHNTSLWVTNFNGNWPKFIYYLYQTINIEQYATGSGVPTLNRNDVHKHIVSVPQIAEQKKISEFLSVVDQQLETQIVAIEKLESLIKGLIDVLFENRQWQKVRLCDFMEFYSTNSLSWEHLQYDSGMIRNLHYGIIHDTPCKELPANELPCITPEFEPHRYSLCKDADVAFADASEDTIDVGKAVELTKVGNTPVICGLHTIHGRDIKGLTIPGFKGFAMNSKYFHTQLQKLAQGSKVFSINTENVKSCYLYIPTVDVQNQLVSLLRILEVKISTERMLLDHYRQQKKYLLSQMFV